MGVDFAMGVLPLDDRGEVVFEAIERPTFSGRDKAHLTPFCQRDQLGWLFDGLDIRWYVTPTINAYLGLPRDPTRADCFDRDDILACLNTILERLLPDDPRVPRHYQIRRQEPGANWEGQQKIYYDGRVMEVLASWDVCSALWHQPRTTDEYLARILAGGSTDPWDLRIDLRAKEKIECHDVVQTPDGPAQGAPLILEVRAESPEPQFRVTLEEMKAFCLAVDPQKYCVYTMRC